MEPKFKNGTAVKLKDDVEAGKEYNGLQFQSHFAYKGSRYKVGDTGQRDGALYKLTENGYWIGEDALELWSEPQQEVRGDIEPLMTFKTDSLSQNNGIDPQLFELVKAVLPKICEGYFDDGKMAANEYARHAFDICKESLRLLREENTKI